MMAYRASVQESTGFTPNKLLFGRENSSPLSEPNKDTHFLSVDDHVKQLDTVLSFTFEFVLKNLNQAQERQKAYYDKKIYGQPFKVGDLVWKVEQKVK